MRTAIGHIDSIELSFGVVHVPGGVILEPVRRYPDDLNEVLVCPEKPVLVRGDTVQLLEDVLPFFNGNLPALTAVDSSILYWAIVDTRIFAARYRFQTRQTDTTFLIENADLLATDNMWQLLPPRMDHSTWVFETWPGQRFKLDTALRLIRRDTVVR